MINARLKTAIVLVIGGSLGYIAAYSNQQPERDANAAAQRAQAKPKPPEQVARNERASVGRAADEDDSNRASDSRKPVASDERGDQVAQNDQSAKAGAGGPQFDAPYYAYKKRNQEAWAKQDQQVNSRLATLEKKFGKKPNIIYILADDVGWGEMGWQGGGKHRGTPTPTLDRMALEGMRFWCAYAEPSCTPSRIAIMTGRHPVRTGLLTVL
jgi:hypothetical protein